MNFAVIYLVLAVIATGATTVFLKLAILEGGTEEARLTRIITQTAVVILGFGLFYSGSGGLNNLSSLLVFPYINGLLGGLAFIFLTKVLKTTQAGTTKTLLAINVFIPVILGVIALGEPLGIFKILGILLSIISVYLLSSESGRKAN